MKYIGLVIGMILLFSSCVFQLDEKTRQGIKTLNTSEISEMKKEGDVTRDDSLLDFNSISDATLNFDDAVADLLLLPKVTFVEMLSEEIEKITYTGDSIFNGDTNYFLKSNNVNITIRKDFEPILLQQWVDLVEYSDVKLTMSLPGIKQALDPLGNKGMYIENFNLDIQEGEWLQVQKTFLSYLTCRYRLCYVYDDFTVCFLAESLEMPICSLDFRKRDFEREAFSWERASEWASKDFIADTGEFYPDLDNILSLIKMPCQEALAYLGCEYHIVGAGVEHNQEGYYYGKYGITLVPNHSGGIEIVECDSIVDISGVRLGMTFAEIQEVLGEICITDTKTIAPYQYSLRYNFIEDVTLLIESIEVYLPTNRLYFVNYR